MEHISNDLAVGGEVAEIVDAFPASDDQQSSQTLLDFQAFLLRERFVFSWPLARRTAELIYGGRCS